MVTLTRRDNRGAEGSADQLAAILGKLGVETDHRHYGIGDVEWRDLIAVAFDGERGQNFIGSRENLMAAAGFGETVRRVVA